MSLRAGTPPDNKTEVNVKVEELVRIRTVPCVDNGDVSMSTNFDTIVPRKISPMTGGKCSFGSMVGRL